MFRWVRLVLISAIATAAASHGSAQTDSQVVFGLTEARGDAQADSSYQQGTAALDQKQWEKAVAAFKAVPKDGARGDGALYWKAYALNKLGRRQESLAAIGELQKSFPASRWVNDARALEVEVRQASGRPVSPDAEPDEDLKLIVINSLMNTSPDRAVPLLEKILQGNHSLNYKERALFVLMQTGTPRARQIAGDLARSSTNPELRVKAIEDLGLFGGAESRQTLSEIYASTNDLQVKKRILQSFMIAGDRERLFAAAKAESNPELRRDAIQQLGVMDGQTAPDLLALYSGGRDRAERKAVIQSLFIQGNASALVGLARKETDPELKRDIVRQLSLMDSKESRDYMMEILNQ
jgi:HEAT repeat protein